jgi:hypothetical protein
VAVGTTFEKVPERIVVLPLTILMVEPFTTFGTASPLSERRRSLPTPPLLFKTICPTVTLSITTFNTVPRGKLICLTRTSNSMRLLCSSYCAKPAGTTPLTGAPVKFANKSPGFGEGEAVGLTVGETVGEAVGEVVGEALGLTDGLTVGLALGLTVGLALGFTVGETVGEPLGEVEGEGVGLFPLLKTPETSVELPFLTSIVEPLLIFGTL